jgi:hypothetical protein
MIVEASTPSRGNQGWRTTVAGLFLTATLGLLAAGCGGGESKEIPGPDAGLQDLKAFLESAKTSGQATTKEAASPVLSAVHLGADYFLRSGQIEFIWGTKLSDEPDAAGRIVAYQKAAATDGGWALFQDGSLKHLTAAEFAAAPRAEP